MSFLDQIDAGKRAQVEEQLLRGNYQLLLGAGASRDSKSRNSTDLPLAPKMAGELSAMSSSVQTRLQSAFELALNRSRNELKDYLENRFVDCIPSAWWPKALDSAWKRIWTLNIDDVVEQALAGHADWNSARYKSYSWHKPMEEFDGLQVIHLHGWSTVDKPEQLIFSISQYVGATKAEHGWHRKFFDEWSESPFVAVGAGLFEEFDLIEAIQARPASPNRHSLYVSRTISAETRELLELANLVPIEATAEDFFAEVEEFTRDARKTLRFRWHQQGAPANVVAAVSEQFEMLRIDGNFMRPDSDRDFFAGDEPEWNDVVNDRAVNLTWYESLAAILIDNLRNKRQEARFIHSKRLAGRTVALLQVSKLLIQSGCDVFWFRSTHRPDSSVIAEFLETRSRAVLIFDGIADFADDVSEIIRRCRESDTTCVVLAADLSFRRATIQNRFDMNYAKEFHVPGSRNDSWLLSRVDAERIEHKIRDVGRFALIRSLTRRERVDVFERREIFDALTRAEYGLGFRLRIEKQVAEVPAGTLRSLVALIATLSTQDRAFPLSFAAAAGVEPRTLSRELRSGGALNGVVHLSGTYLRTRFRAITPQDVLKGDAAMDDFFEAWIEFLKSIRIYAGKASRRERSAGYILVKTLMRYGTVQHVFGKRYLTEFYERLWEAYQKDSRFWEQRARAQIVVGNYTQAMSYAAAAVDLAERDSWRRTTYGDICLIRACEDFAVGSSHFWELYDLGQNELDTALVLTHSNSLPAILGIKRTMKAYYKYYMSDRPNGAVVLEDLEVEISKQIRRAYSLSQVGQTVHATTVRGLETLFLKWVAAKNSPEHWGDPNVFDERLIYVPMEELNQA